MFDGRIMRDKLPQTGLPVEVDNSVQEIDKEKKYKRKVVGTVICKYTINNLKF